MTSRLDRLVLLLDTGSPVVRNTAADQLADIQKAHPHELYNLLGRVVPFLHYPSWDTRVAAARAIGGIVEHVKQWDPNEDEEEAIRVKLELSENPTATDQMEALDQAPDTPQADDRFAFASFDITNVIKKGQPLLGSAGKEYDLHLEGLSAEARLLHAKQNVTARLGLGAEFMDADLLTAQDLALQTKQKSAPASPKTPIHPTGAAVAPPSEAKNEVEEALSARQRNMLKRKARMAGKGGSSNKVRVIDVSGTPSTATPKPEAESAAYFSVTEQALNDAKVVVEHKLATDPAAAIRSATETNAWPLDALAEILTVDLFDTKWERRHGASMALREILRAQAPGAGRRLHSSRRQNDDANRAYLDDVACRICCVFALDRFGDYVADQVVAPIRESVSQTLAALLKHLASASVASTFGLLCQLIYQEDLARPIWEVTHGGMLGLKYLVAMRKDVLLAEDTLLDQLISVVFAGLGHTDDDVRAVAAATLIPIAEELISKRPAVIDTLLTVLWDCLADMRDDLSASTGSVMDLLAQLCSFEAVIRSMRSTAESDEERTFAKLIPRLYAFFRHTITTVRSAVLRAMRVLVLADEDHRVDWINDHLLRLVFQNLLVEQSPDVLALSFDFWTLCLSECQAQSCPLIAYYPSLLKLVMTPVGHGRQRFALDRTLFVRPSGRSYTVPTKSNHGRGGVSKRGKKAIEVRAEDAPHDIDGPTLDGDVELVGFGAVIQNRCFAARGLGRLLSHWPLEAAENAIAEALPQYLQSRASSPCYLSAILMQEMLEQTAAASLKQRVRHLSEPVLALESSDFYSNFASSLHALRAQCQNLINVFGEVGRVPRDNLPRLPVLPVDDVATPAFGLSDATDLLGQHYDRLKRLMQSSFKGQIAKTIELAHSAADQALTQATSLHLMENTRIAAAVSGALIRSGDLPKKLNPIIKALMESVKTEPEHVLQKRSAENLAVLVHVCHESGRTAALDKLIKNLCAFLCIDADRTPEFGRHSRLTTTVYSVTVKRDTDIPGTHSTGLSESQSMRIKRMGAQMALEEMLLRFGPRIFAVVPKLQQCIHGPLEKVFGSTTALPLADTDVSLGQEVIDALCIFRDLMKSFDPTIHEELLRYTDLVLRALQSDYSSVRFAAASCLAAICSVMTIPGMQLVIERVLPLISNSGNLCERQGAIETVHLVVQLMDVRILPYVIFLIVPVLGRMSDSDNDIRDLATRTFAQLVKLVPLEAGIPDPPGMPEALLAERDNERKFIQQMLDGSKVEAFRIPVAIKADLRSYQQDGVNWLAFLNRYQLHGILCDDMGLGKTLQTICIVASDHHHRQIQYQGSGSSEWSAIPSLVVCPPTLTGHWEHELSVYAPFLNVVGYVGPRDERLKIQSSLSTADVVVTSYDIVRNDVEFLSRQSWNYCVLDEGHIIKNSKAKLTQAVKLMKAGHRLILSGTPIQNNVLELWSLFDFLMPGFLGTEKSFYARYAKPIASSREAKSSSKDHEAGVLALEALHKQVLPFLLRRLKEDVLSDLPPKIIQDYYCNLSPLQQTLYNTFTASQAQTVASETTGSVDKSAKSHVFQALQYMRKLCNHPSLVLTEKHPDFARITKSLHTQNTTLKDVKHGPKLLALRDLLVDCGLGNQQDNVSPLDSSVVNQHRALIFCQMKDMLDLVEVEVLKNLLPSISYMRLDGSTDPRNRQAAVQKFNADPSIDVLLLTTHVGGLGLNLTGADTVIFVEHDWNPMKDLQAMDRAHRLGQKKTVNVYRLITKDTLEEKIMGLQRFKLNIASSVVNQQNTGLATMDTDQILDLFSAGSTTAQQIDAADETGLDAQGNVVANGSKALFDDLQELHAQSEYADFNDLSAFVSSL